MLAGFRQRRRSKEQAHDPAPGAHGQLLDHAEQEGVFALHKLTGCDRVAGVENGAEDTERSAGSEHKPALERKHGDADAGAENAHEEPGFR